MGWSARAYSANISYEPVGPRAFSPLLARWALAFGPAEYFALMCFAFACITGLMGDQPVKAMLAASIGLSLSTVGLGSNSGVYRFTGDNLHLSDGIQFIVLVIGLLLVPNWLLVPGILAISAVGVYSMHATTFDLWMMGGFGLVAYLLRKGGVPMAPLILGFVLGDMMEQSLRRALSITNGELGILWQSPSSLGLWVGVGVGAMLVVPPLYRLCTAAGRAARRFKKPRTVHATRVFAAATLAFAPRTAPITALPTPLPTTLPTTPRVWR